MSLIVAGRFTTFPAAESAAQQLFERGFVGEDVTLFFVNPRGQHALHPLDETPPTTASLLSPLSHPAHHGATYGAVVGAIIGVAIFTGFAASLPVVVIAAGVGAYIGAKVGAMIQARSGPRVHHERVHRELRASGVLVAVHVTPENQLEAAQVLRAAGGADIERASGHWQQGRWADFDPRSTPDLLTELNQQQA
ncbi:DUF2273 domain-containing protein [Paraburkholderia humisilvae]|uniref:Glycine zipper domain-containing protein n=1 Tax=Paraburkholderia humisilvae TaxID=627669 RepID=A0A6J5EX89_9BURK|nr:DUF2273 domain-containing protein [Paraburkholderia humisilvae]CAB3771218.1 hypothetical protein LMG29542_06567 [Paraburkholderia humisilvae]